MNESLKERVALYQPSLRGKGLFRLTALEHFLNSTYFKWGCLATDSRVLNRET